MSKQTFDDVFAPAEAHYKSIVIHQTFGHLFPDGDHYEGSIRVSCSIYGDIVVLDEDIGIDGSPWWFDAVNKFAGEMSDGMEGGDVCEFKIVVDIVEHSDPDECNDPDHPEDDVFNEYQTIEVSLVEKKYLIKAY